LIRSVVAEAGQVKRGYTLAAEYRPQINAAFALISPECSFTANM